MKAQQKRIGIVATPTELKNGHTSESLDRWFRETLAPPQYWAEIIRRAGERERQCYGRLVAFNAAHEGLELSVQAKKELAALTLDFETAVDARRRAASALSEVAA